MSDGTYRVVANEDGTRTLYLFPPNGGLYRYISVDTEEPEEESDETGPIRYVFAMLRPEGHTAHVLPWSASVFDDLLTDLAALQAPRPDGSKP